MPVGEQDRVDSGGAAATAARWRVVRARVDDHRASDPGARSSQVFVPVSVIGPGWRQQHRRPGRHRRSCSYCELAGHRSPPGQAAPMVPSGRSMHIAVRRPDGAPGRTGVRPRVRRREHRATVGCAATDARRPCVGGISIRSPRSPSLRAARTGEPPRGRRLARESSGVGTVGQRGHEEPGVVAADLAAGVTQRDHGCSAVGRDRESPVAQQVAERRRPASTSAASARHDRPLDGGRSAARRSPRTSRAPPHRPAPAPSARRSRDAPRDRPAAVPTRQVGVSRVDPAAGEHRHAGGEGHLVTRVSSHTSAPSAPSRSSTTVAASRIGTGSVIASPR